MILHQTQLNLAACMYGRGAQGSARVRARNRSPEKVPSFVMPDGNLTETSLPVSGVQVLEAFSAS